MTHTQESEWEYLEFEDNLSSEYERLKNNLTMEGIVTPSEVSSLDSGLSIVYFPVQTTSPSAAKNPEDGFRCVEDS